MLRNKELKRFVILFFITAFIAITSGFSIDWRAGILCSISSAAFGSLFFIFTRARYQNIARISEQIDLVLIIPTIYLLQNQKKANFLFYRVKLQK